MKFLTNIGKKITKTKNFMKLEPFGLFPSVSAVSDDFEKFNSAQHHFGVLVVPVHDNDNIQTTTTTWKNKKQDFHDFPDLVVGTKSFGTHEKVESELVADLWGEEGKFGVSYHVSILKVGEKYEVWDFPAHRNVGCFATKKGEFSSSDEAMECANEVVECYKDMKEMVDAFSVLSFVRKRKVYKAQTPSNY